MDMRRFILEVPVMLAIPIDQAEVITPDGSSKYHGKQANYCVVVHF